MKILLLGGSGRLGTELQKYFKCDAPSSNELDITKEIKIYDEFDYDLIINCAAFTDVVGAEKDPIKCLDVNVNGTINLLNKFRYSSFIYISSEYAKNPVNFYGKTKQLAERMVEMSDISYLIIRTSFSERPWPYDNAFMDSYTQGDYLDVIAPLIAKRIKRWNKVNSKLIYVGTGRKTIYSLAEQSRPDVRISSINEIKDVRIPSDYL